MIEKFKTWLDDNSITEVECLVPDLGGIARGKILPTNKFLKGLEDDSHRLPQSTFIQTISGDYAYEDSTGTLPKSIYNPTDVDVILKPDFNRASYPPATWLIFLKPISFNDFTAKALLQFDAQNNILGFSGASSVL